MLKALPNVPILNTAKQNIQESLEQGKKENKKIARKEKRAKEKLEDLKQQGY